MAEIFAAKGLDAFVKLQNVMALKVGLLLSIFSQGEFWYTLIVPKVGFILARSPVSGVCTKSDGYG